MQLLAGPMSTAPLAPSCPASSCCSQLSTAQHLAGWTVNATQGELLIALWPGPIPCDDWLWGQWLHPRICRSPLGLRCSFPTTSAVSCLVAGAMVTLTLTSLSGFLPAQSGRVVHLRGRLSPPLALHRFQSMIDRLPFRPCYRSPGHGRSHQGHGKPHDRPSHRLCVVEFLGLAFPWFAWLFLFRVKSGGLLLCGLVARVLTGLKVSIEAFGR
jgi:hypothetical protein